MIEDASVIRLLADNSCGYKLAKTFVAAPLCLGVPVLGWLYGCARIKLVPQGHIGLVMNSGRPELLGPGWHGVLDLASREPKTSLHERILERDSYPLSFAL